MVSAVSASALLVVSVSGAVVVATVSVTGAVALLTVSVSGAVVVVGRVGECAARGVGERRRRGVGERAARSVGEWRRGGVDGAGCDQAAVAGWAGARAAAASVPEGTVAAASFEPPDPPAVGDVALTVSEAAWLGATSGVGPAASAAAVSASRRFRVGGRVARGRVSRFRGRRLGRTRLGRARLRRCRLRRGRSRGRAAVPRVPVPAPQARAAGPGAGFPVGQQAAAEPAVSPPPRSPSWLRWWWRRRHPVPSLSPARGAPSWPPWPPADLIRSPLDRSSPTPVSRREHLHDPCFPELLFLCIGCYPRLFSV